MFVGGDDYEMLKNLPTIGEFDTCEEIIADYLNKVGMDGIEESRIKILKEVPIPEEAADGEEPAEMKRRLGADSP